MIDICIIGGGAAGLTAAISAKEADSTLRIVIIEKKEEVGKKLLATGNGKCNMTNLACPGQKETLEFFGSLGVLTRHDSQGRVYPYTEEARAVRDALLQRAEDLGVEVFTSAEVLGVKKNQEHFLIELGKEKLEAEKLLIATGGKSAPQCGSTGDGYRFAKSLGHKVNRLVPVLTAIDVKEDTKDLAGIRAKAKVSLTFNNEEIFSEEGEVQFTATGVSGICIFNMSRFLLIPEGKTIKNGFDDYRIHIDFFPEVDVNILRILLAERRLTAFKGNRLLDYMVKKPLAERILKVAESEREVATMLKDFQLSPSGAKGWNFAQVTKGGVALDEVVPETMESRLIDNLFFAGEVLDYDGPCGGFNLQYAWETGIKAGRGMAREHR